MTLGEKQELFARLFGELIVWTYKQGYALRASRFSLFFCPNFNARPAIAPVLPSIRIFFAERVSAFAVRFLHVVLAFLPVPVPHIVFVGAKEKVPWINARRIVASVKNMQSFRDWAIGPLVSQPMRSVRPQFLRTFAEWPANLFSSITVPVFISVPFETSGKVVCHSRTIPWILTT